MNTRFRLFVFLVVMLCMAATRPGSPILAQSTTATPPDTSLADETLREQNIYIPYEKLREVFEKHGRGVFLPYEQFEELWRAARDQAEPAAEPKPPVAALITEIHSEATVAEDVIRVTAELSIEVLAEGWHEVPLRLGDAAISRATLDDQPARLVGAAATGYRLLVEKKGDQPEQMELRLEYSKAIDRAPGRNSVLFAAPQAPVNRWEVRIPQQGVKVNVLPLIAAAEVPEGADEAAPGETLVRAFVGAAPMVQIDWTPRAEGATGLEALASVQAEQEVRLGEGGMRTIARLVYAISRADLSELSIEVPADQKVVNVFDPNVRRWSLAQTDNGRQRIMVELFEPAKESQQIVVELEQFAADREEGALSVPTVKALGVERQQGVLVIKVDEAGLRATAEETRGLLQIDSTAAETPRRADGVAWDFAYRYATAEYALTLSVEKVEPRLQADVLVEATLEPERLTVDLTAVYTVERAGVFQLEMDLPEGFDVRYVRGRAVAGARAADVDSHDLTGPDATRLVVDLASQATPADRRPGGFDGRVGLVIRLERNLPQSDLLTPGGQEDVPLTIPRLALGPVEQVDGRVLVRAPDSLRVNAAATEGLRSVSFNEALKGMNSGAADQPDDARPMLAFAFVGQSESGELTTLPLIAERRRPQVTMRQLLVMRIDSGVVKYEATFFYNVLYSGVESLWIDVPPEVSPRLRNKTKTVQEEKVAEPPETIAAQGDAWKFTAESEFLGEGRIELVWEETIDNLGVGKSIELAVPYLKPLAVDRAWGQIVLAKAETLDVQEKELPTALQLIDHGRDLIAPVADAARAMEFHEDWALSVVATQYELEEVKRTSLEKSVARMVVTRDGQTVVQALYRIRSARQRLQVQLPAGATFDTEPARINGRAVTLQGGDAADAYLVPLVGLGGEKPFVLELRYVVEGDAGRLDLPVFPEEPAVLKVSLGAYLPEEWALLGASGPWTEEFGWAMDSSLRFRPVARAEAGTFWLRAGGKGSMENYMADQVRQVCEGIEGMTGDPATTFPTDGRLFVFSALRPAPPPDGSLRLTVLGERTLGVMVFLVVFLGGLVLLRAGASRRALAVGALVAALVLCGVFATTFALQVLGGVLLAAIFLVLVTWAVRDFVQRRSAAAVVAPVAVSAESPFGPTRDAPASQSSEDQSGPQSEEGGRTDD